MKQVPARPTVLTFGIPLKSTSDAEEWQRLNHLLGDTLRSIYNQTDPSFRIILACDREPEVDFATDSRLTFLKVKARETAGLAEGDSDAGSKRWHIARRFVRGGGGYLMLVDADDWVSNRLVRFVDETRHPAGYIMEDGLGYDSLSRKVLPIPLPGVADARFDLSCGSSVILRLEPSDFEAPAGGESRFARLYRYGHPGVREAAIAEGRPLLKLPFPGSVYVFNTGISLSDIRRRDDPAFAAGRDIWTKTFAARGADLAEIAEEFGQAPDRGRSRPPPSRPDAGTPLRAFFSRIFGRRRPPEVVVLGASNSIGAGSYITRFARHTGLPVQNLSLGASASTVGLYQAKAIRPARNGFAILDYTINDNDAGWNLWGPARAPEVLGPTIRSLAATTGHAGYFPFLLMLPSDLDDGSDFLGERLHLDICHAEKISYLNLRRLFLQALAAGVPKAALMRDDWHMSDAAAELLALFLAGIVSTLARAQPSLSARKAKVLATRIVPAEALFPPQSLFDHESSLRHARYGTLKPGMQLEVMLAGEERVAGIVVNGGADGAGLILRGNGREVVKLVNFGWNAHRPKPFFSVLIDIAEPLPGHAGRVIIELADDDRPPTENTIHSRPLTAGLPRAVEVEGILITGPERDLEYVARVYPGLPLDLGELAETARLRDGLFRLTV